MEKPLPDHGTYQLVLSVPTPVTVKVGALGSYRFVPGTYIYTGRATRGLAHRLARHQRKDKPLRWHIDYLTSHPHVTVDDIRLVSDDPEQECSVVKAMVVGSRYSVPVPGFGASDCRSGCPAHLVYVKTDETP